MNPQIRNLRARQGGHFTCGLTAICTVNADNQNTSDTFDGEGSPTTYKGTALTFDAEDRLISYGAAMTAGYRGDGLRAWKSGSSGTSYFVYDGITPVCEVNSSGAVTATNSFGAAGLLSRHTSGGSVFYAFDPSANPAERLNGSGSVLGSYAFDAFGARSTTDAAPDVYSGFGSQAAYYSDAETGAELLGHRYYDQARGRFLNRDPLSYAGGVDLYGYVGNEPVCSIDPFGLAQLVIVGGGAFGLIPQHMYIRFPDGYSAGFWPRPAGVGGPAGGSSGSSSGGGGGWLPGPGYVAHGPEPGSPQDSGDPDYSPTGGYVLYQNNDPCFEQCLRDLIQDNQASPPTYWFVPSPATQNCVTWAVGVWNACTLFTGSYGWPDY